MSNIGFCVFGRPTKHEFKSNGLFEKLKLGDGTYIEFSGNKELQKNDSICMISRSIKNDIEIIKIYYYENAISHNKRDGGFVGSGIVFCNDKPTEKLLYNCFSVIQKQALKLVNDNRQFKEAKLNQELIKLVNLNTEGLLVGQQKNRKAESISKGTSYGVKIEGHIFHSLMGIVQGFISNPDFNKIERLYISKNTDLLKGFVGEKKVVSFQRLLSFRKLFESANSSLIEKREKYNELIKEKKKLEVSKEKLISDIKNKNKEIQEYDNSIEIYRKDHSQIKRKVEGNKRQLEALDIDIIQKQSVIANQVSEIEKSKKTKNETLRNLEIAKFEQLLREPLINEGRKAYEHKVKSSTEKTIKRLRRERNNLNDELYYFKNQSFITRKILIAAGTILFIGLISGGFIGYMMTGSETPSIAGTKPKEDSPEQKPDYLVKLPKEYKFKEFLELPDSIQKKHKKELDKAIRKISSNEYYKTDIKNFLEREWNFGELIDYHKVSLDSGKIRLKKIQDIYRKYDGLNEYALYTIKKKDFNTNKRDDILGEYLKEPNNIYEDIGINEHEPDETYEKKYPLLYMHFRLMIHELSVHKEPKDKDLNKTNKESHMVRFKRK